MDPLLIDIPERLETERLVLRCPRAGDGEALHDAVSSSLELLRPWAPWAREVPSVDASEAYCRRMHARFVLREDLVLLIFENAAEDRTNPVLGAVGLHRIDWQMRTFELGYWRRAGLDGLGVVTEAVVGLSRMGFDRLAARRIEIRMDDANERSRKVAERAGYTFEALLRQNAITPAGAACSTRVYARVRGIEEPSAA